MTKRRCSSLPMFVECPSSGLTPRYKSNRSNPVSDEGTCAHEAAVFVVKGEDPPLAEIARQPDIDMTTLRVLVAYVRRAWGEISKLLPEGVPSRTEVKVESDIVRGSADVIFADGEQLIVVDWKSGHVRRHHMMQLGGYAHAAVETFGMPASGKVTIITPWLRFSEMEIKHLTESDLGEFETLLKATEEQVGEVWNPGWACEYCPMWDECDAQQAHTHAAAGVIEKIEATALTPEKLAGLYAQSKLLAKALKVYDEMLRTEVARAGKLALPDGRTLMFSDRVSDPITDIPVAWKMLREDYGFTMENFAGIISMSKTKALKVVSAKTAKGKGAAAKAAGEALKDAGATTTKVTRTLQAVKKN